ncbi:hypothetical protein G6514_002877 [Epicoccum nigrum]|nr:hypothetical protein G6514_002877 [Epicoccum nigrum]
MSKDPENSWVWNNDAVIIGTTNNALIAEVEDLGEVSELLNLSDQAFENALRRMIEALNLELVGVRKELEVLFRNSGHKQDCLEFLQKMFDGEGHRLCGQSLKQVIPQFETLPKDENASAPEFV